MVVALEEKNQMKKKAVNVVNSINTLKDEIVSLKVIVIRNLQDENEKLRCKSDRL